MSYGRMKKAEPELAREVDSWLQSAELVDRQEDQEHGQDRCGDEIPAWVANKAQRLEKLRVAKAALEAEAKAAAEEKAQEPPRYRGGRKPKTLPGTPADKAQRNFTDAESRNMKGRDGFIQGYNAQAAVNATAQVIVAHGHTDNAADSGQLAPMLDAIEANTGQKPAQLSADSGYCSEDNLVALEARDIDGFIATGRQRHGEAAADGGKSKGPKVAAIQPGGGGQGQCRRSAKTPCNVGRCRDSGGRRRSRGLDFGARLAPTAPLPWSASRPKAAGEVLTKTHAEPATGLDPLVERLGLTWVGSAQ